MSVNKIILIGRAGKDPEVKMVRETKTVAKFTLATDEYGAKDEKGQATKKTQWHTIICWDGTAEVVSKYVKKGQQVYVEGRLSTREYEVEGVKKIAVEIIASSIQMLGKKDDNAESSLATSVNENAVPAKPAASKPAASKPASKSAPAPVVAPVSADDDETDLPF